MRKIYTYCIFYSYEKPENNQYVRGMLEFKALRKIKTFDDLIYVKESIEEKHKVNRVIIDNYILLNKRFGKWED